MPLRLALRFVLLCMALPSCRGDTPGSTSFVRRDSAGIVIGESRSALVAGDETFRQEVSMGTSHGVMNSSVPFGLTLVHAIVGDCIAYGDGRSFEVRLIGRDGELKRIVRLIEPNPPLEAETIEEWKAYRRSFARNDGQRQAVERLIAAQTFPDRTPTYSVMLADAAGDLWVERYRMRPDDPQRRAVFDTAGAYAGTVATPSRFTIHEIGRDYMLGAWQNEDDVEIVRLNDLVRVETSNAGA